ncbi:MAG: ABC transporter ATP-binding protein [SAR324 cluster bacterium]|nr:ABC transporter ATP-binding protein [SAR324 cluster bacterium]
MESVLNVKQLYKGFKSHDLPRLDVIKELNLEVFSGDTIAIVGQSGSGKSTLLALLAALDQPDSGQILVKGQDIAQMNEDQLARFRARHIGIVFQQFHLLSHLSALENVSLPMELARHKNAEKKAVDALGRVGLIHRTSHFSHQLSGGECQRVAIARAIVSNPAILLADEPTGNLDVKTGEYISDMLFDLVHDIGMTMILVTHNEALASRCSRQFLLNNGRLEQVAPKPL